MTYKKVKSLDDLIKGIKQLLSESRCSFSDEDVVLLNDAVQALEQVKKVVVKSGEPDLSLIAEATKILLRLFTLGDQIKDLF